MYKITKESETSYQKGIHSLRLHGISRDAEIRIMGMNANCIMFLNYFFLEKNCIEQVSILDGDPSIEKWERVRELEKAAYLFDESNTILLHIKEQEHTFPFKVTIEKLLDDPRSFLQFIHKHDKLPKKCPSSLRATWEQYSSEEDTLLCLVWYRQCIRALQKYIAYFQQKAQGEFASFYFTVHYKDITVVVKDMLDIFSVLGAVSRYFAPALSSVWKPLIEQ